MHPYVHCSILGNNSQDLEATKCQSIEEWIKKLWYIYTMERYLAIKKEKLLPFVTAWRDLESIMVSKISQTLRGRHHMILPLTGT